jgi:Uma2 family endonuclease
MLLEQASMSIAVTLDPLPPVPSPGSSFVLDDVSWDTYIAMRRQADDSHSHVRMSYDNGRLALMSPLPKHEWFKTRVGRLIEMATLEWDIPIYSLGQTTWKSQAALKGLEADECYYIQNEAKVRSRDDLDLRRDPPPDLALEVGVTHHPIDRMAVYAGLKIGEVWLYNGKRIEFLKLGRDGRYRPVKRSIALPRLTPADIQRFLAMFGTTDETSIIKAFRDWLRAGL